MLHTEKKRIFNVIILDESGSMESIKDAIISGFNEIVQSIKSSKLEYPEQEHFITFVSFNTDRLKTWLVNKPVSELHQIDGNLYKPNACTPLYDAIGYTLTLQKESVRPDDTVLVTIMTDGLENASKEYSRSVINALIRRLSQGDWVFTYIGANHDVVGTASNLSIVNALEFKADISGTREAFREMRESREQFQKVYHEERRIEKTGFFKKRSAD